jgi:hypothetical protein
MPSGNALTEMLVSMAMDFVLNLFYITGMLYVCNSPLVCVDVSVVWF